MKRLLFGLIFLMVVCTCGCVDVGEVEPEITPPTIAEPTVTSSPPIATIPYTTPEPTETPPSPTSVPTPTPTPKTTETIYYTFSYPDVVTVNITVPIEDVAETEKFLDLLDDAQDYMLNASDNSNNAFWLDDNARITASGLEPGKDIMYWIDVIKAEEEAISFSEIAIQDFENTMVFFEKAKDIAPTEEYERICDIYIKLSEKGIYREKYGSTIEKNMKYTYEQCKDWRSYQGDTVIERTNENIKEYNHESYKYDEILEDLPSLIKNL